MDKFSSSVSNTNSKLNLDSSIITITGGTGSFGSTMLQNLLRENVSEVRVFSRDETKQDQLRNKIRDPRLKLYIGDVRDQSSIESAIEGADYVFHAAALKQVPSCEFFPMQALATNVTGSFNVINVAIKYGVKKVVCLSTDKAVYPINAMGMSKALMEKVAQSFVRNSPESKTKITITRYGNVMMSRGSVIPLFLNQIRRGEPISVTNPKMTRFLMSLDDSVTLVKQAFTNSTNGDLLVKKTPACSVETLVEAICRVMDVRNKVRINYIGTRHGEKLYESLLGSEEGNRAVDCGDYYRVPLDTRSLDYQIYFNEGQTTDSEETAYTSHNSQQLNTDQVAELISNLQEFKEFKETYI